MQVILLSIPDYFPSASSKGYSHGSRTNNTHTCNIMHTITMYIKYTLHTYTVTIYAACEWSIPGHVISKLDMGMWIQLLSLWRMHP